ncbi:protein of unknown function (plasmid) [Azospirillum baldaniorum]|uniref:Uncharacterized protein n=1 Tax=Azospirillum baldaniorum TaxID=1064539 RepID=A0A9P1NS57_9PROT|nr:protein of unknown function [Azospirillum baldaniorum]
MRTPLSLYYFYYGRFLYYSTVAEGRDVLYHRNHRIHGVQFELSGVLDMSRLGRDPAGS